MFDNFTISKIISLCEEYEIEKLLLLERKTEEDEPLFVVKTRMDEDGWDFMLFEAALSRLSGGCGLYNWDSEVEDGRQELKDECESPRATVLYMQGGAV